MGVDASAQEQRERTGLRLVEEGARTLARELRRCGRFPEDEHGQAPGGIDSGYEVRR